MTMTRPLPLRLWMLLKEPRIVTALHAVAYAIVAGMGIATLVQPPTTLTLAWGPFVTMTWAVILTISGSIGAAGCIIGHWWLEAVGIGGVCLGVTLYVLMVFSLHFVAGGNRVPQALGLTALIVLMTSRYFRIKDFALDPSRQRRDADESGYN